MKKFRELLKNQWFGNLVAVCAGVILYMFFHNFDSITKWLGALGTVLSSTFIGVILAYLMDPVVKFFEARLFQKAKPEKRRNICVILTVVLMLVIVITMLVLVIPSLITSLSALVSLLNDESQIEAIIEKLNEFGLGLNLDLTMVTETIDSYIEMTADYISENLSSIMNMTINIGNAMVNFVIGFIIALYLLLGKDSLVKGINEFRLALLGEEKYETHTSFWKRCHEILISYIGCDLLDGVVVGIVNAIIMMILRMPYIPLISVIVAVTNLLPTFGPVFGAIIGALLLLFVNPIYALWFLIICVVLQAVDGYIIKPKMFGNSLGIPAVISLVSVIIGGKLWGVAGMLLAIPMAAILMFLYREHLLPWLRRRQKNAQA